MIMNYHKDYSGRFIEFKSPTNNYQVSQAQKEMKHRYKENGYYFLLSNWLWSYNQNYTWLYGGSKSAMQIL